MFPDMNASNMSGIWSYLNDITGNWFGNLTLILIFFVSFFSLKTFTTDRAFLASSFLTSLVSLLLFFAGIVPFSTLMICIILTFIAIVNSTFSAPQEGY